MPKKYQLGAAVEYHPPGSEEDIELIQSGTVVTEDKNYCYVKLDTTGDRTGDTAAWQHQYVVVVPEE